MSKVYNPALQERLESYLANSGISQAKLAPKVGISQTALSQYRRSKYDNGDIAELERKLEEFFRTEEAVEAAAVKAAPYRPTLDYIPTSISEDVYKAIQYCQIERGMVILHGDAGIGKTKGAERFIRENPNAAVYIQATPSSGTLGNILKLLARALRVPETRNKLELQLAIRDKLEGTNKVIIIDEAQHLKLNALEEIRTLSDPNSLTGQRGTGICLIGNTEVYDRFSIPGDQHSVENITEGFAANLFLVRQFCGGNEQLPAVEALGCSVHRIVPRVDPPQGNGGEVDPAVRYIGKHSPPEPDAGGEQINRRQLLGADRGCAGLRPLRQPVPMGRFQRKRKRIPFGKRAGPLP